MVTIRHRKVAGVPANPNVIVDGPAWDDTHLIDNLTAADVGLGNVPNVDTTNASNISSGTLPAARLPTPSPTTLGGVKAIAAVALQFLTGIGTDGTPTQGPLNFTQHGTGAATRSYDTKFRDALFARDFGIKADVVEVTCTVTIASGSASLTATGASFQSTDVGKTILVPGAGAAGAYLTTTIATFVDATHVTLGTTAGTTVTAVSKVIRYGTDDYNAINNAITEAKKGYTLIFTDGKMFHGTMLNWAWSSLHVQFLSDDTVFIYTGSGATAHSFSGMVNYPGSQGCLGAKFGLPGLPMLRGHPGGTTTNAALLDNYHFGILACRPRDATRGLRAQDTGIVLASAVCTRFYIECSGVAADGPFIVQPNSGINCDKLVACTFYNPIVEACGANSVYGMAFTGCINNTVIGGTVESNSAGGFIEDSTSSRNTYINFDSESNGTGYDFNISGKNSVFIGCTNGGTTNGAWFKGNACALHGGTYTNSTIDDDRLHSINTEWLTACTNNGTHTTIINPLGTAGVIAVEQAATLTGNKTVNTDNGNILKIGSVDVTAAWATYTPTLAPATGAFTTAAITSARYMKWGKLVTLKVTFTVTAANTATGQAIISLPTNALSGNAYAGAGLETASNGKALSALISSADNTKVRVTYYDATTPWVNGTTNTITITYEAA